MLQKKPTLRATAYLVAGAADSPPAPLSFSIQNCNSLSLTGTTGNFDSKLTAIVMAKTDIILLSDTRAISSQGVSSTHRISNALRDSCIKKYNVLFNSSSNSRGTAIFLAADLDYEINAEYKDTGENYFIVDVSISGVRYCIGAIYGPNNTCRDFYRNIHAVLTDVHNRLDSPPRIILGGDWNTVVDRSPVHSNIDIFCMAAIPNSKNSELLENLCERFNMSDPFRILYPTKCDYSYVPFGNVRLNRSRLDFFIVSRNILPEVTDCRIDHSVSSKLFDHKRVTLTLNHKSLSRRNSDRLGNTYLTDTVMMANVELAARRTSIFALELGNENRHPIFGSNREVKEREMARIAACDLLIDNILRGREGLIASHDETTSLLVAGSETELQLNLENMIPLDVLYSLEKRCSWGEFFEHLVLHTRKHGSKMQKKLHRLKRIRKENIETWLTLLKQDYRANVGEINKFENLLRTESEIELRECTREIKTLECLASESVSSHLLELAKKGNGNNKLGIVRNDQGEEFLGETERGEYIRAYYSKLYTRDLWVGGTIEEFLGDQICSHPTVIASKLTADETDSLDSPLSIEELDQALKKANLRSAPGVDGFSYRFIQAFWGIYRLPLFLAASSGLENGTLPESFMVAKIKLIPKKGDGTKIKNWRPISLLSNFYKIISRLINSRLQKIVDRLLSRSQKGFTKSRQIQEVIINCTETMSYCRRNNIKAVLASIDQSKAFDSVDHGFMEKVYEFFGFGDRIKRWLKSIGTGRFACIQLENDSITDNFELGKGHAQGDSPSPLLYNLAVQIQIFKIELNPNIPKIMNEEIEIARNLLPPQFYKHEGLGQTENNESFADDSSNLTLFTIDALTELKNVLDSFKTLSGLSCNLEKSFVMRIGNTEGEVPQAISSLGFTFVNKINLLGFTLCNYGDSVTENYEKVIQRITNLIRFWDRFKLGLTAKISIYKSLLLPQINYVATIFTPPPETLSLLEKTMENFVIKGFTIPKNRVYLHVDKGGLGLFRLGDFVTGLQCSWIIRCFHLINDNWRARLVQYSNGSIINSVNDPWVKDRIGPILCNIMDSYNKFRTAYAKENNNYKVVPIYCNDAFGYGRELVNKLDDKFLTLLLIPHVTVGRES